ncbi:MAG: NAD-dependent epimerase/dehydratase family protein [Deltaproteobacteria bacterium]|nr:NAD-dependent epimerase/dehydratase family protein [Deltaproteobacteria bacterium]
MGNQKNVTVTGGSGLLGSALVHLLLEETQERPVVLDINPDPARLNDVAEQIEYV